MRLNLRVLLLIVFIMTSQSRSLIISRAIHYHQSQEEGKACMTIGDKHVTYISDWPIVPQSEITDH